MELIENRPQFISRFSRWNDNEGLVGYPFVENIHAPLTPLKRALPMSNIALISSAGGYIDGTEPFDTTSKDGDIGIREIPIEVDAADIRYAAKGYDDSAVKEDRNCQVPIDRLREYEQNAVIGHLNDCWWSISPYIPNAAKASEMAPKLAARLDRYAVQAAILIPASRLCHQTLGIIARGLEQSGIPTIMISVDPAATDRIRPPRTAYYAGEFGRVAGEPNWREHQLRILDETIRWIETFDQPGSRRLVVELETQVEAARGER